MSGIEKLLPLLEDGTRRRKLVWEPYGETGLATLIGTNTIVMDYSVDEVHDTLRVINLLNADGETVDTFSRWNVNNDGLYQKLLSLYDQAKRVASRADEILDDVEAQLKQLLAR